MTEGIEKMSLIDRETLIAEYDRVHVGAPGGARKLMVDAPEVKPKQLERCPIYRGVCVYPSDKCYDCPRHDPTRIANKLMMPEPYREEGD